MLLVLLCVIGFLFIAATYESSARIGAKYANKIYYKSEKTQRHLDYSHPDRTVECARREYTSQEVFWYTRTPILNYFFAAQARHRYLGGSDYHDALARLYALDRGEQIDDINKIVETRRAAKLAAWEQELGISQKHVEQQIDSVRTLRAVLTRNRRA